MWVGAHRGSVGLIENVDIAVAFDLDQTTRSAGANADVNVVAVESQRLDVRIGQFLQRTSSLPSGRRNIERPQAIGFGAGENLAVTTLDASYRQGDCRRRLPGLIGEVENTHPLFAAEIELVSIGGQMQVGKISRGLGELVLGIFV